MADLSSFGGRVGFLGAGNMASALIRGILRGGLPPRQLLATDLDRTKLDLLSAELGTLTADSSQALIEASEVVILATKPDALASVLPPLRAQAAGRLWVSVAAGVTTDTLESWLGEARVIRAMPNTPALVGEGATGLCPGRHARREDLELAEKLLAGVGITVVVTESAMDAVTGLSGSGPAFLMLVIEAMADAGVHAGLPRDVALRLAAQTVRGAGALALESGRHPAELKDQVTSPGGTTIAGVRALERGGLRSTMMEAVLAATARCRELADK